MLSGLGNPQLFGRQQEGQKGWRRLALLWGFTGLAPPMGPYSFDDSFGMKLAVCILICSLDPGRTEATLKFLTARFLWSAFSSIYHASSQHKTGMAVLAQGTTKIFVTNCPSYSYWFKRYMHGVHKHMGEEVQSDYFCRYLSFI
jgi:hypothetical protein